MNNFFLLILMTFFYFLAVGLSALVLKIISLFYNTKKQSSYWLPPPSRGWTRENLRSPY